jgi:hypothetical protein
MIADGHFYSSSAFLGWVGIAVAIVTLTVIAAQFAAGSSKRALVYSLISDTTLLSEGARERAGPGLRVTLGDDTLDDLHVVSLRIECKGGRDIRSADFEGGKPLMLRVGTPILKQLSREADDDTAPCISFNSHAQTIGIGPDLIKKGQHVRMRSGCLDAGRLGAVTRAAGGRVPARPGTAGVQQDRSAVPEACCPADGPAGRGRQRDQDDLGALAAHAQHPVAAASPEPAVSAPVASEIREPGRPGMAASARSHGLAGGGEQGPGLQAGESGAGDPAGTGGRRTCPAGECS